jgi:hypothetical protein
LLKATVKEFIYMGDIFRTRLSVAGNDDFIIKSRNAPDQVRLQPGQEIEIGWLATIVAPWMHRNFMPRVIDWGMGNGVRWKRPTRASLITRAT